jgi:hypothetical protein
MSRDRRPYLEGLTVLHGLRRVVDEQLAGDKDHERSDRSRGRLSIRGGDLVLNLLERQALYRSRTTSDNRQCFESLAVRQLTFSFSMIAA